MRTLIIGGSMEKEEIIKKCIEEIEEILKWKHGTAEDVKYDLRMLLREMEKWE